MDVATPVLLIHSILVYKPKVKTKEVYWIIYQKIRFIVRRNILKIAHDSVYRMWLTLRKVTLTKLET